MRTLVEPPHSSHCELCGGELRLKQVESANRTLVWKMRCLSLECGHEQSIEVTHNHTARLMPGPKVA